MENERRKRGAAAPARRVLVCLLAAATGCGRPRGAAFLTPEQARTADAGRGGVAPAEGKGGGFVPAAGGRRSAPAGRDSSAQTAESPGTRGGAGVTADGAPPFGVPAPERSDLVPRGGVPAVPGGRVEPGAAPAEGAAAPRAGRRDDVVQGRWIRVDGPQPVLPFTPNREPIGEYMQLFSAVAGVNIILSSDSAVQRVELTGAVRGLPWHLALEALLDAHGLRPLQGENGVITIVTAARAAQERDPAVIRLTARYAHELFDAVKDALAVGADSSGSTVRIIGDPDKSQELAVTASPERVAKVRQLARDFDRQPARVVVEMRMVSVDRKRQRKLGINFEMVSLGDSTGVRVSDARAGADGGLIGSRPLGQLRRLMSDAVGLDVFIDAAQQDGLATMETAPHISTESGKTARIQVGDNRLFLQNSQPIIAGGVVVPGGGGGAGYPGGGGQGAGGQGGAAGYPAGGVMEVETGTIMEVTPYVNRGLVKLRVELSRLGGVLAADGQTISGGNTRMSNEITLRAGQPLVIAGLTTSSRSESRGGVPLLSDLPGIGRLFRVDEESTSFRDLILILTPRILPALTPDEEDAGEP